MAKEKDPRRVAAGKKAAATRAAAKDAARRRRSSKPKLPSLSKTIFIAGGLVVVTGVAADRIDDLIAGMQSLVDEAGLGIVVTGASIAFAAGILAAASSFSPWFGRKYRGFLRRFGLRP